MYWQNGLLEYILCSSCNRSTKNDDDDDNDDDNDDDKWWWILKLQQI